MAVKYSESFKALTKKEELSKEEALKKMKSMSFEEWINLDFEKKFTLAKAREGAHVGKTYRVKYHKDFAEIFFEDEMGFKGHFEIRHRFKKKEREALEACGHETIRVFTVVERSKLYADRYTMDHCPNLDDLKAWLEPTFKVASVSETWSGIRGVFLE